MRDKTFPPLLFFRYTPPHFHVRPSLVTCTSERKIPLVNVNLVSPPTANKDWRGISWGLTTVHIITLSQPILPSVSFSFNDCIGLDLYYLLKSNTLYSIRKRRIKTAGWYRLKPMDELHLDVIVLDPNRLRVISRNWHVGPFIFCYETGRWSNRYPDHQLASIVITIYWIPELYLIGLASQLITRIASTITSIGTLHCA
jgi:hypothetical protein